MFDAWIGFGVNESSVSTYGPEDGRKICSQRKWTSGPIFFLLQIALVTRGTWLRLLVYGNILVCYKNIWHPLKNGHAKREFLFVVKSFSHLKSLARPNYAKKDGLGKSKGDILRSIGEDRLSPTKGDFTGKCWLQPWFVTAKGEMKVFNNVLSFHILSAAIPAIAKARSLARED